MAVNQDDYNTGFLITSKNFCKKLPLEARFGNLSCSGSLSKLNSPELSKGRSPFTTGLAAVSSLSANLPGYTSFSKAESTFLQLKGNNLLKKKLDFSVNTWISSENSSPLSSAMLSYRFPSKKLTLNTSFTSGQFDYSENSSSSWFLNSPYYQAGSHQCSLFQFSADYINKNKKTELNSLFMTAVYESPFGPLSAVYRTDLRFSYKQIEFYSSAYLNPYQDILTSSQKKLKPAFQFKSGFISRKPLISKKDRLIFLKYGANAFTCLNLTDTQHLLRFNTGAQISTELTSISFYISADALLYSTSPEIPPRQIKTSALSLQLKNSWYLKSFTPGFTFNIERKLTDSANQEDSDITAENDAGGTTKYKVQINVTKNSKHKLNGSLNFSITSKDREITDKKISAGMTGTFNLKRLTVIGKASYSHNL